MVGTNGVGVNPEALCEDFGNCLSTSERDRLIVMDRDMFVMFERERLMWTRVSYDLVIFREEHQCRLLRREAWSLFEVSVGITNGKEKVVVATVTSVRQVKNWEYILATPSETSKVENAPAEMLRDLDQQNGQVGQINDMTKLAQLLAIQEDFKMEVGKDFILMNNSKNFLNYAMINSDSDGCFTLVVLADAVLKVLETYIGFEYWLSILKRGQSDYDFLTLGRYNEACVIDFGCSYIIE
ncbi:hypothetical protein Tco_0218473 [Tanacetum coccineum]